MTNETPPLYTAAFIAKTLDVQTSDVTKAYKAKRLNKYGTVSMDGKPAHVFAPEDISVWQCEPRQGRTTLSAVDMAAYLAEAQSSMTQDGTQPPAQAWLPQQACADLHWLSNYAHHGGATANREPADNGNNPANLPTRVANPTVDVLQTAAVADWRKLQVCFRTTVVQAWRCGNALAQVKAAQPHGAWTPWLKANGIPARSARRLMQIAKLENGQLGQFDSVDAGLKFLQQPKPQLIQACEPVPLPEGVFDCIAVDPPWPYPERADNPDTWHGRVQPKYKPMPLNDIAALHPPAADNAVVYLWATQRFLFDAAYILERWECRYRATLTWVKADKRGRGRLGCGKWLRFNNEFVLMGTRGNPDINLTNQTSVIHAKARQHSRKPTEFVTLAESLQPNARRLEMFSRQRREGWQVHGDQCDHFALPLAA